MSPKIAFVTVGLLVLGLARAAPICVAQEASATSSVSDDEISGQLSQAVDAVLAQPSPDERRILAGHLFAQVRTIARKGKLATVSDGAIADIARLLGDPKTAEASCMMLAEFGSRAQAAVPAIETAIAEEVSIEQRENRNLPVMLGPSLARNMRAQLARIKS